MQCSPRLDVVVLVLLMIAARSYTSHLLTGDGARAATSVFCWLATAAATAIDCELELPIRGTVTCLQQQCRASSCHPIPFITSSPSAPRKGVRDCSTGPKSILGATHCHHHCHCRFSTSNSCVTPCWLRLSRSAQLAHCHCHCHCTTHTLAAFSLGFTPPLI